MPRDRGRGRSRGGVFRLNSGATTFGRSSTLPLNAPAGSFMAGRPAGGGGDAITRALASSQGPSVQGPVADFGPPSVTPSPVTPDFRTDMPDIPSFTPPATTSFATQALSAFPSFKPIVQPPDPRRVRYF